ncbi:MAG: hypothetical protein AVDCRST_MAG01-01-3100 [uncultured Rubrobacteraceae bacterium]|uniref:Uncharacterized protein n=1 Tax=uncultured Rubrobacteraceae bacterium TaxID=349277 RepID=A0A6J4Q3P2_9ACTN|nr:MAG: hypothetical protein AVDCRST_MAG01-01-3100 [uncultured Rubrobacteraceae bacterium]
MAGVVFDVVSSSLGGGVGSGGSAGGRGVRRPDDERPEEGEVGGRG